MAELEDKLHYYLRNQRIVTYVILLFLVFLSVILIISSREIAKTNFQYQSKASTSNQSTYVADYSSILGCEYKYVTKWGNYGSGIGQFNNPFGIAVDSKNHVWVADTGNSRVQVFDENGNFIRSWGSEGIQLGQFKFPVGVSTGTNNYIVYVYVTDRDNHRVQEFDDNGNFIRAWGNYGTGNGQFIQPMGIAADLNGDSVFVNDAGTSRIRRFTNSGTFVTVWGGSQEFIAPIGMTYGGGSSPELYVADTGGHKIKKYSYLGSFISSWGGYGSADGQFNLPTGISVDNSVIRDPYFVYVADSFNSRIQIFKPNGEFLGKFGSAGNADGQFSDPKGVAFNLWESPTSLKNMFVLDSGNSRVQRFDCISPTPTPTPTKILTPTPFPTICKSRFMSCTSNSQCCSQICAPSSLGSRCL